MTIALPQIPGHNKLTHSRIQCLQRCPRKHHYRYVLGIRPKSAAKPLRLGSAGHLGLDARAKGLSQDDAVATAVAGYEVLPDWCKSHEQIHEWMVERETVARLLMGYFWYWEREGLSPDITVAEVLATEQSFEIPIINPETGRPTPSFTFAGKIDGIVRLGDGRLAVMEHKTTGEDIAAESDYWRRLKIDGQISGYFLAARTLGYDVQTVLYNVIKKPTISPRQIPVLDDKGFKVVLDANGQRVFNLNKKGEPIAPRQSADSEKGWVLQSRVESAAEFGERLNEDIAARPEFYFRRQEIPRLDADLDEFRAELWDHQQAIREGQRRGWAFRATGACVLMGRCEYLDNCLTGFDLNNLPSGFEQVGDLHPELKEADE